MKKENLNGFHRNKEDHERLLHLYASQIDNLEEMDKFLER